MGWRRGVRAFTATWSFLAGLVLHYSGSQRCRASTTERSRLDLSWPCGPALHLLCYFSLHLSLLEGLRLSKDQSTVFFPVSAFRSGLSIYCNLKCLLVGHLGTLVHIETAIRQLSRYPSNRTLFACLPTQWDAILVHLGRHEFIQQCRSAG